MVLASIYLSVSSSLPSTANIKPVEVWLLFNLAYPLLVIIVNVKHQVCFVTYYIYYLLYILSKGLTEEERRKRKESKGRREDGKVKKNIKKTQFLTKNIPFIRINHKEERTKTVVISPSLILPMSAKWTI